MGLLRRLRRPARARARPWPAPLPRSLLQGPTITPWSWLCERGALLWPRGAAGCRLCRSRFSVCLGGSATVPAILLS